MNPLAYSVLRFLPADGPVEKFIAVKFTSIYQLRATPALTISGLLKALGIPPNTGREPLKTLINKDFIEATQQRWHPGPPHYSFRFRPKVAFPSGYDDSPTSPHQSKIAQLLEWNESPPERRRHQLTIAQRVLLMLLLASSTRCGVVESLSQSHLARQLGKPGPRIRYDCNRLKGYGYIRCTVDGGNFERIIGTRNTIYFLELHHESYDEQKSAGVTVIKKMRTSNPIGDAIRQYREHTRAIRNKRRRSTNSGSSNRPALFFAELLTRNQLTRRPHYTEARADEIHHLLRIIDRLAEWSLTIYHENLASFLTDDITRTLYTEIGRRLGQKDDEDFDSTTLPEKYTSHITQALNMVDKNEVANSFILRYDCTTDSRYYAQVFLVACVIHRAKMALSVLRKNGEEITPNTDYLILPHPEVTAPSAAFCVESYPASPDSTHHELRIDPPDPDDPATTIDDLPMYLYHATSLRTRYPEDPRLKRPPSARRKTDAHSVSHFRQHDKMPCTGSTTKRPIGYRIA